MARFVVCHRSGMRTYAIAITATALLLCALATAAPAADPTIDTLITPEPVGGEQCGNCQDDDGDGLVDAEDPDCCPLAGTLDVRRARVDGSRLDIRALLPAGLDVSGHAARLVVSREDGPIVCHAINTAGARARRLARRAGGALLRPASGDRWALVASERVATRPTGALRVTLQVGEMCVGAIAVLDVPNGRLLP